MSSQSSELIILSWRHHPSAAIERPFLSAVIRPQISTSPPADRAAAATLNIRQRFLCAEAVDRQLAMMVTGPIAFTLAIAEDEQLANAVGAD